MQVLQCHLFVNFFVIMVTVARLRVCKQNNVPQNLCTIPTTIITKKYCHTKGKTNRQSCISLLLSLFSSPRPSMGQVEAVVHRMCKKLNQDWTSKNIRISRQNCNTNHPIGLQVIWFLHSAIKCVLLGYYDFQIKVP